MNNTGVSNRGEKKGCKMIDSTDHFHIQELLDIYIFVNEKMQQVITMIIISPDSIMWIYYG